MKNTLKNKDRKLITGLLTLSYPNVFEAVSVNGGKPKFSVCLIIPKTDAATIANIAAAVKAAYRDGEAKLKGNGDSVPSFESIKKPLRDGDADRLNDPAFKNSFFLNAGSVFAPGIVDADLNPVTDRSAVYSGVSARVSISFYAYNINGNVGIACGLNNVQVLGGGKRITDRATAKSDFSNDVDDDFLK